MDMSGAVSFAMGVALLAMASGAPGAVVLSDDCDWAMGSVSNQNPGVWDEKVSGNPVYTGSGEMRLTSGHAARSIGEWNPEGDEGYSPGPAWDAYPPGDPKPVTVSFDFRPDDNLAHAARLSLVTRNSNRGSMEARGLRAEIRPFRDSVGFFIETSGSGLWNGGDLLGSLQTDGSTTGNAMVTGGFTGDLSDNANRYKITATDTIDLYTLLIEGTAGSIIGESLTYSLDLSGATHKNTDSDPAYNHVWIGNDGGNFNVDNILVTTGDPPGPVAFTNVVVADTVGMEFATADGAIYELESTPDLLNSNDWTGTGAYVIGNGTNRFLFDPDTFSSNKNYRVHEQTQIGP